jgi:hypothetical protein
MCNFYSMSTYNILILICEMRVEMMFDIKKKQLESNLKLP